jgi:translation initiation factor IF-3
LNGGECISKFSKKNYKDTTRVNERLIGTEVRVISDDGEQLGVMQAEDALKIARNKGLDLVEVAPNANPPVCRIMDYGKYKYTEQKRAQQAKKKQKKISVKEMKFRPKIDEHDFEFKKKHIIRFLEHGDKVKVTIRFRGREIVHRDKGFAILERLKNELQDIGQPEKAPTFEGIHMVQVFAPKH